MLTRSRGQVAKSGTSASPAECSKATPDALTVRWQMRHARGNERASAGAAEMLILTRAGREVLAYGLRRLGA